MPDWERWFPEPDRATRLWSIRSGAMLGYRDTDLQTLQADIRAIVRDDLHHGRDAYECTLDGELVAAFIVQPHDMEPDPAADDKPGGGGVPNLLEVRVRRHSDDFVLVRATYTKHPFGATIPLPDPARCRWRCEHFPGPNPCRKAMGE